VIIFNDLHATAINNVKFEAFTAVTMKNDRLFGLVVRVPAC
jgi:hypothetical protein